VQLDVFTEQALMGNALAVFPEADEIPEDQMQQIAREMNLSETVFVLPPQDKSALKRLRIFTPASELPFAGHPVVGTWYVLAHESIVPIPDGGNGSTRVFQELGVGVLPVDVEFKEGKAERVVMTQGKFEILGDLDDGEEQANIARALGLAREDLDESLPIQAISTGLRVLVVPVRSLEDLSHCRVNLEMLGDIYKRAGTNGVYAFSRETLEIGEARAHARFFLGDNIGEDPATGSAAGPLGAYLVHHGVAGVEPVEGTYRFIIEQGDFIKRPSRIGLEVKGAPGKVEQVRVGGPSVIVARGELIL
jgi:trans-2,3-dihydro-3-hydroxyanthranilate isomerase